MLKGGQLSVAVCGFAALALLLHFHGQDALQLLRDVKLQPENISWLAFLPLRLGRGEGLLSNGWLAARAKGTCAGFFPCDSLNCLHRLLLDLCIKSLVVVFVVAILADLGLLTFLRLRLLVPQQVPQLVTITAGPPLR